MVNWDLLDQPWDSVEGWTKVGSGTSEINPAGYLHQAGQISVSRVRDIGELPNDGFTFEVRGRIIWNAMITYKSYRLWDGVHELWISIYPTYIDVIKGDLKPERYYITTESDTFYVWRFTFDSDGHSLKLYRDGEYLYEWTDIKHESQWDGYIEITDFSYFGAGTHTYDDYIKVASGLHPPLIPAGYGYSNGLVCVQT